MEIRYNANPSAFPDLSSITGRLPPDDTQLSGFYSNKRQTWLEILKWILEQPGDPDVYIRADPAYLYRIDMVSKVNTMTTHFMGKTYVTPSTIRFSTVGEIRRCVLGLQEEKMA